MQFWNKHSVAAPAKCCPEAVCEGYLVQRGSLHSTRITSNAQELRYNPHSLTQVATAVVAPAVAAAGAAAAARGEFIWPLSLLLDALFSLKIIVSRSLRTVPEGYRLTAVLSGNCLAHSVA